jgi:transposase
MDLFVERCAGIDIGKVDLKACVRTPGPRGGRRSETRTFATTTAGVLALRAWLTERQVSLVGMESTGVYWKPIFYPLEDHFACWLINPQHIKKVPGRKSDLLTELPDRILRLCPRVGCGVATFRAHGQRRGCAAGVVAVGGAAARVG